MTKNPMMATAARMRTTFTSGGSLWARRTTVFSAMSTAPALEEIDQEERDEGDREDDDRDRGGLRVGELLQPGHHQHGGDLGLERHVARDEHHRAVLPERACEGEREARDQRRRDRRHDDAEEGLQAVRAEARRRLLEVGIQPLEHRLERPDDEREADEDEDEDDPEPGVGGLDAERDE